VISEYAFGHYAWVLSSMFLSWGIGSWALVIAIWSQVLFGFLAFAVYSAIFVFPLGPSAYGPGVNIGWPPRIAFLTYMLWVVILGWQAIRFSCRASTEIHAKG
jgi:hypothetical protein